MKPSSPTSQNATNASLRGVPFVILTLSKAKGKNLRTTWQSMRLLHSVRNDVHGVTLIEMLVALVITALIVSSVYVAFNAGTKSWQVGDTMMQKYQNARGALDFMTREMSTMYMTISSIYETGLIYDSDSFRFRASIPGNSGDWDLCMVGYQYDAGDKEIERLFFTNKTTAFATEYTNLSHTTSEWKPMVSNINSLGFRWWDGSAWYDDPWYSTTGSHEGEIPKAIEITITVQDDKQLADERTFRTVVYIPRAEQ